MAENSGSKSSFGNAHFGAIDQIIKRHDELGRSYDALANDYADTVARIEVSNAGLYEDFQSLSDGLVGHSIIPDMVEGIGEWFGKLDQNMARPAEAMARDVETSFRRMGFGVANAIGQMAKDGEYKLDSLRRVAASVVGDLRNMIIDRGVTKPLNSFFGSVLDGIFGKAAGGPVSSNHPYVVGERGPELFVPSAAGKILANGVGPGGRSGQFSKGAMQLTYNIDARGADPSAIQRLERVLAWHVKNTPAVAIAAVRDNMARNPNF